MPRLIPFKPTELDNFKRVDLRVSPRTQGGGLNIAITGNRDQRGSDNNIFVWIDENDHLHIAIEKADRCYSFLKVEETPGYVVMTQI